MTCAQARAGFSGLRDEGLSIAEAAQLRRHLAECAGCAAGWQVWNAPLDALGTLSAVSAPGIEAALRSRLELAQRGPGPTLTFLSRRATRPLLLPSLVTSALIWVALATPLLARLDAAPVGPRLAEGRVQDWGRFLTPLAGAAELTLPREAAQRSTLGPLSEMHEGVLFVETVVGPSGRVSRVRVLSGSRAPSRSLIEALGRQRFEPGRLAGEAVTVAVYRLFDRLDVRAPLG